MFVPVWVAAAFLAILLSQFAAGIAWAIRSDKQWSRTDDELKRLAKLLTDNNIAVMSSEIRRLDMRADRADAAHERNRDRIERVEGHVRDVAADLGAHTARCQAEAGAAQTSHPGNGR